MGKNTFLLTACILFLVSAPITSSAEEIQPNLKEETQLQIVTDLSKITQQKLLVQEEMEATAKKIQELDQQITLSNDQLQAKEKELTEIKKKINSLNKEYERITTLLTNRKEEFKDRISSYYRSEGQMSFLNVLFSINSFGDFINHFIAYDEIIKQDKKFIESYIANQNKVKNIKEDVAELEKSKIDEKTKLEAIKLTQENNKKEKETLSSLLEEKRKQLEKQEQEKKLALELLQQNGEEILKLINSNIAYQNKDNQLINSIIAPFIPDAQKLQQEKGVPASITLGQIILESSGRYNGLSGLAFEAKNLFGIKGTGTEGTVIWNTTEYVNGQKIEVKANFAKYKTYYDSMVDHADLLLTPRYQKYLKNVTSIVDYAQGLFDAGYATDPNYVNKLLKLIYQNDLLKFDL